MNIFSRRKRLLNRTSARINSGPTAHGRGRIRRALWRDRAGVTVTGQGGVPARFRKIFRRNRVGAPAMPKMSSRRQFHRALRRHPAWPLVMAESEARAKAHKEQAAARARAQKAIQRDRAGAEEMGTISHRKRYRWILNRNRTSVMVTRQAPSRTGLRRAIRRNRVFVVTLLVVGALVAVLYGIGAAGNEAWVFHRPDPTSAGIPKARFGAATTFDGNKDETLIFGGFGSQNDGTTGEPVFSALSPKAFDETWGWSGGQEKWSNRNPVHKPSPRGYVSMAYDAQRKNVVLFGGANKPIDLPAVYGDTWTWDGQDWTLHNPPGPTPSPRRNASMVYDAHRKVVVLYGGQSSDPSAVFDDTWTWDGTTWKQLDIDGPPARLGAAMAYDLCRAETVLFGGAGPIGATTGVLTRANPEPGQTWTFNGTEWTNKTPASQTPGSYPTRRIGGAMAYSPWFGRVLMYGGLFVTETGHHALATDDDFWNWDGTTWARVVTPDRLVGVISSAINGVAPVGLSPPPRGYASFSVDPNRPNGIGGKGSIHLFGGTPGALTPIGGFKAFMAFGDQWSFLSSSASGPSDPISTAFSPYRQCSNPVPIPPDAPVLDDPGHVEGDQTQKKAVSEIQEVGRIPALLGTPRTGAPAPGAPGTECMRRRNQESTDNTRLVTDPSRHRIYQFFLCDTWTDPSGSKNYVLVAAHHSETLKMLGSALIPIDGWYADLVHDPTRGRFLYRKGRDLHLIDQALIEKGMNPVVGKITLTGRPANRVELVEQPATGRSKLLITHPTVNATAGPPPSPSSPPALSQIDLDTLEEDWTRELTGCTSLIDTFGGQAPMIMRLADKVYTTCVVGTSGENHREAVVRIPLTTNEQGKETPGTPEVFPGPWTVSATWGDPQAERVLLLSGPKSGGFKGWSLWVFDGKASRYVGEVGLTQQKIGTHGFDPRTGRFYMLVHDYLTDTYSAGVFGKRSFPGGLLTVDTRLTPASQPVNFRDLMYVASGSVEVLPGEGSQPTRIVVRRAGGSTPVDPGDPDQVDSTSNAINKYPDGEVIKLADEMHYTVYSDRFPVPDPTTLAQLDALTIPVAESPGKTEAIYDASGSGYGLRLRSVGGLRSAISPFPQTNQQGNLDQVLGFAGPYPPTCIYPDRELMAGWVTRAGLSDLSGSAVTIGMEVDQDTKRDLQGPSTRCIPQALSPNALPNETRVATDQLWPLVTTAQAQADDAAGGVLGWDRHFKEVECVGDASDSNKSSLGDVYASTDCRQKDGLIKASSRGAFAGSLPSGYSLNPEQSSAPANPDYSIAEGYSEVVVTRDPLKGVVVTSTAVAKGIKLPGLYIAMVRTQAVSWSNGRISGEPRAQFKREICGVATPTYSAPTRCLTDSPNGGEQKQFVDGWNRIGGINSKMILPTPDKEYFKGSPGGYIAGVIKPEADEIEDRMFARDFQKEVPGLEIIFYKDSFDYGPGRQVLQLAATRAVAGYGVQCSSERIYSPQAKDCVILSFDEPPATEEFFEDQAAFTGETDEGAFNTYDQGGGWTQIATGAPEGLALGTRVGRYIANLPVIRQLPIRAMGEALLAASVWLLLGLPLYLASKRFDLNLAKRS